MESTRGSELNITKQFVFVHMPKTGGTFVAQMLREVFTPAWMRGSLLGKVYFKGTNLLIRQLGIDAPHIELEKHATCREIPARYAHLPIVGCMRNPFDWYVSNYKFQYWKRNPDHYPGLKDDPKWPDLDFAYFLHLSNHVWVQKMNPGTRINPRLGRLTTIFVQYYCREPEKVLEADADGEPLFHLIKENMYPVTFLDTASLNDDFHAFLAEKGFPEWQIGFVKTHVPVSPPGSRKSGDRWEKFYTPALRQEVLERDWILFRLFPLYQ